MTGTLPAGVRAVSLGTRDYKICGVFAVQGGFNQSLSVSLQLRPVYSFAIKYFTYISPTFPKPLFCLRGYSGSPAR